MKILAVHSRHFLKLGLVAALLFSAGISCSRFKPHYTQRIGQGDLQVKVEAKGTRAFQLDAVGAPHAFGCVYPTGKMDHGFEVSLQIRNFEFPLYRSGEKGLSLNSEVKKKSSKAQLRTFVDSLNLQISPDERHIAFRKVMDKEFFGNGQGGWVILHLLEAGPPFFSSVSSRMFPRDDQAIDWNLVPSPEKIVMDFLDGKTNEFGFGRTTIWKSLNQQKTTSPWVSKILDLWPQGVKGDYHADVHRFIVSRAQFRTEDSKAWRQQALTKAKAYLNSQEYNFMAVEVLANLDDAALSCEEYKSWQEKGKQWLRHPQMVPNHCRSDNSGERPEK